MFRMRSISINEHTMDNDPDGSLSPPSSSSQCSSYSSINSATTMITNINLCGLNFTVNKQDLNKLWNFYNGQQQHNFIPKMKSALIEHQHKGSPIVRPMWWNEKSDNESLMINDQFMVGNDIVVAPIIEEGKTERDIYLPRGWWKDEILAQVIRGGKWMRKYQVPLDKVAFFIRTEPSLTLPIQKNEITKTKTKI